MAVAIQHVLTSSLLRFHETDADTFQLEQGSETTGPAGSMLQRQSI